MLDHALAAARADAAAEHAAMKADMATALAALGEAYASELALVAQAIAAHVLGTVPQAADQALLALAQALGSAAAADTQLRAHPASAARLAALLDHNPVTILADPALSAGMVAARVGPSERVDSLAMRLDRIAAAVVEQPA